MEGFIELVVLSGFYQMFPPSIKASASLCRWLRSHFSSGLLPTKPALIVGVIEALSRKSWALARADEISAVRSMALLSFSQWSQRPRIIRCSGRTRETRSAAIRA